MPFSNLTLDKFSLGGSETAVIAVARELRKRKHIVNVFCPLPPEGRADFVHPGSIDDLGIRWMALEQYPAFIQHTEVDLLVVSRQPELMAVNHQARKAVLWVHDLATHTYTVPTLTPVGFNFDEVWTVSEYHRQQYHKVTGYPLENIRATRNGALPYETLDMELRNDKQLLYAARPERGLESLVRPGGIMSRLPEFKLLITMYDNFPEQLRDYYGQLFQWAQERGNCEVLGPKSQSELRQLMKDSKLYVYPTNFEEVSCIIARECMSAGLPMVTTGHGALTETLAGCGHIVDNGDYGSDEFCERFAEQVRALSEDDARCAWYQERAAERTDLGWEGVAEQWESWADPAPVKPFSRIWSLIEDSDVVPAIAFAQAIPLEERTRGVAHMISELERLYPYLYGRETFAAYYERYFKDNQDPREARKKPNMEGNPRFEAIAQFVSELPDESSILDYGCAEGVIILGLAKRFPNKHFSGVDFAQSNIDLCRKYAAEDGLTNVEFSCEHTENIGVFLTPYEGYDAVICSEVLEHVAEPWYLLAFLEARVEKGGMVITTVPQGPWEAIGLYEENQYEWRAHIWHINKWMLRKMLADKENPRMTSLTNGHSRDGRILGHLCFVYKADHKTVHAIDPVEKALQHRSRQSVAAAIIAKDSAETILKMLNSLGDQVQQVQVALADSSDDTAQIIHQWASHKPWIKTQVINVPAVEPKQFGFDDARNASILGLDTDWIVWIDTDEYLSGDIRKYARGNAFHSYAIHQHHFTVEPRGGAVQLDKPARMFRNNGRFQFFGKVHEHAELGENGGPGFCFILPDVDLGHIGYVNEDVRRGRFNRNFPLLVWDREVYPERRLGKFLWLRDIIHRMRYAAMQRDIGSARLLAEEALSFYKEHCSAEGGIGVGDGNDIGYVTEARELLGRGVKVEMMVRIDGSEALVSGIFEDEEEAAKIIKKMVKAPLDKRRSGYYQ